MNNKEVRRLKRAKYIAQHEPCWSVLFSKIAIIRSERARRTWELCCKSLVMQARDFKDAWFVLDQCPSYGDTRDICIVIAANLATEIGEINMVSVKVGNSKHQQLIDDRRSAILAS